MDAKIPLCLNIADRAKLNVSLKSNSSSFFLLASSHTDGHGSLMTSFCPVFNPCNKFDRSWEKSLLSMYCLDWVVVAGSLRPVKPTV